jgi:hypothetical protein
VRKRLEEAAAAKKAKKGFMTPERKKKLRVSFKKFIIIENDTNLLNHVFVLYEISFCCVRKLLRN